MIYQIKISVYICWSR